MLKIALVTGVNDCYKNYKFNFHKNSSTEFNKSRSFNILDHDNLFIETLHKGIKNIGANIDHVENYSSIDEIDVFFYIGFSRNHEKKYINDFKNKLFFLYINEPPAIIPEQWTKKTHQYFDKIFINNKKYLDNKKYVYVNGITVVSKNFKLSFKKKKYFSVFFATNMPLNHQLSLYKNKIDLINFFEEYYPEKLHLYGRNWDLNFFYKIKFFMIFNKIITIIKKLKIQSLFFKKKRIFKGFEKNKMQKISEYKFDFALENSVSDGFITGRIFHSFFAGTVPIYLGSKNIENYIPKNTFIDFRKYSSIKLLYAYLSGMSDKIYNNYIINIKKFVKSKRFKLFTLEYDVGIIIKEICKIKI